MDRKQTDISRREFLRRMGIGAGSAFALTILDPLRAFSQEPRTADEPVRMTYRVQHGSG
mgnify:FL=1